MSLNTLKLSFRGGVGNSAFPALFLQMDDVCVRENVYYLIWKYQSFTLLNNNQRESKEETSPRVWEPEPDKL